MKDGFLIFLKKWKNLKKTSSFFPPEEYFTNKMSKEKKALLKEELNSLYPEIKNIGEDFLE